MKYTILYMLNESKAIVFVRNDNLFHRPKCNGQLNWTERNTLANNDV